MLKQDVTVEMVNDAFKEAAKWRWQGLFVLRQNHLFPSILIRQQNLQLLMDFQRLSWES